jgi:hypothetical protein
LSRGAAPENAVVPRARAIVATFAQRRWMDSRVIAVNWAQARGRNPQNLTHFFGLPHLLFREAAVLSD